MGLLSYFGLAKRQLNPSPTDDFWYKVDPSTGIGYRLSNNAAGISVDEVHAMTYSACWAATMLIMTAVGSLPLKLFRKVPGGGSEPAVEDPRYSLVHDSPNPDMTAMLFRGSRTAQQVNWGNGFAEIERNAGGKPVGLYPIHAVRIPVTTNIKRGPDGRLRYLVNQDGSTDKREIHADNMLHIPSPMSDDGIIGKGVVSAARLAIGFGIAAETHGAAYFANSARPNLILEGAKFRKPEDAEDFRRMWEEVHGGPAKNAKPAILPPDTKLHTLQFNAEDSQFLESRQFSIEDVARFYGVPPHAIGSLLRATNNNIEQQALELRQYTLMRWTVPFEQELDKKLLSKDERKTMFFRHVFDGLERADIKTRTDALKEQFFNGKITLNEWRGLDDQRPIGPAGDVHFVQMAMQPIEIAAKGPQQPAATVEGESESDALRQSMDAYGIGVRAGAITPQTDDEEQYRQAMGLPPMSEDAKAAWTEDKGVRRPITLQPSGEQPAQPAFGQPPAEEPDEDMPEDDMPPDDGMDDEMSVLKSQLESLRQVSCRVSNAMLRDAMARMLSVEIHAVKHIAEKPNRFDQRLKEFYDKHSLTMTRSLTEPITVALSVSGDDREPADVVYSLTSQHVEESMRQLIALTDCTADELPSKVEQCVATWHDERTSVAI